MASADFTKLTGKKLQNIEKYKNQGNIKNIADIKTSGINIDFEKVNSIFSHGNDMVNFSIAVNLSGMSGTDFMAMSKEEQAKYRLLAELMDADNDGKVNANEMQALTALSDKNDKTKFDAADIESLLQIVNDAGVEELLTDIDGVFKKEAEEAREATHSHGEFDGGLQIDVYDKEVYVKVNGKEIEGVTLQDDGSYTFKLNGETKIFKTDGKKGIDFYNSTLEYNDTKLNINKLLDEPYKQQGTGDCYFLASINALSKTEDGKKIIENSITYNADKHTYTVNFAGVNCSYTFNADEINEAEIKRHDKIKEDGSKVVGEGSGWYSEGDDDVLLLEMAFEQFRQECSEGKFEGYKWPDYVTYSTDNKNDDKDKSPLTSGSFDQVCYVLTGKEPEYSSDVTNTFNMIKNSPKSDSFAIYLGVTANKGYTEATYGQYYINDTNKYVKVDDKMPKDAVRYNFTGAGTNTSGITLKGVKDCAGQEITISSNGTGNHSLMATKVTNDTITIVNPWDSSKEITVSRKDIEQYTYGIAYANLDGQVKALEDKRKAEWDAMPKITNPDPNAKIIDPPKKEDGNIFIRFLKGIKSFFGF